MNVGTLTLTCSTDLYTIIHIGRLSRRLLRDELVGRAGGRKAVVEGPVVSYRSKVAVHVQ